MRDPRAYYAIAALAPAIFFVTILASYRGYFQGMQRMLPTGFSQIAEQLVLGERTVGNHISSILSKLHLANRTQAARSSLFRVWA